MRAKLPKRIHDQGRAGADEAMVEYFEIALLSARSGTPMFLSGAASLRRSLTTRTPKTRQTSPRLLPHLGRHPNSSGGSASANLLAADVPSPDIVPRP
jgi:hypothetical protein